MGGESPADTVLHDLPPSAKLVLKVLEYHGALTQQELANETRLPTRTVRYALAELEELNVLETQISFRDARQRHYSLTLEDPR